MQAAELRAGYIEDLIRVSTWIRSAQDCQLWAGARLSFPIEIATLASALEFASAESWCLVEQDVVLGFGQIVPKPLRRLHLARLIVSPAQRGRGLGKLLAERLLRIAQASTPASISLNVAASNVVAVSIYRSLGFVSADRPFDEPPSPSLYMQHLRR